MKKRLILLLFLWMLVLTIALIIFLFSAQTGEQSLNTSNGLTYFFIRLFHPDYDTLDKRTRRQILRQFTQYVRKAAHFTEFAALGTSLRMLFQALRLRCPFLMSWLVGTLYACTDEWHQTFVGSRGASWTDVGIDSAGVFFGALFISLFFWLWARYKERPSS